jgi:hypothetical protein
MLVPGGKKTDTLPFLYLTGVLASRLIKLARWPATQEVRFFNRRLHRAKYSGVDMIWFSSTNQKAGQQIAMETMIGLLNLLDQYP